MKTLLLIFAASLGAVVSESWEDCRPCGEDFKAVNLLERMKSKQKEPSQLLQEPTCNRVVDPQQIAELSKGYSFTCSGDSTFKVPFCAAAKDCISNLDQSIDPEQPVLVVDETCKELVIERDHNDDYLQKLFQLSSMRLVATVCPNVPTFTMEINDAIRHEGIPSVFKTLVRGQTAAQVSARIDFPYSWAPITLPKESSWDILHDGNKDDEPSGVCWTGDLPVRTKRVVLKLEYEGQSPAPEKDRVAYVISELHICEYKSN